MDPAPPGMIRAPESFTQLLLSFSSIPTQDPILHLTRQDQQEEVGPADLELSDHDGGSWIQAEHQFLSATAIEEGIPPVEEALDGCEADSRNTGGKEQALSCAAAKTDGQINTETHEFDQPDSPPPYSIGDLSSGDQTCENSMGPESTTPNYIHSPQNGQEQGSWKRRAKRKLVQDFVQRRCAST